MAKFKVGDTVRITDKVPEGWWFKPGMTAKIEEVDDGPLRYALRFTDGVVGHVNDEHIEPALNLREGVFVTLRNGDVEGPLEPAAVHYDKGYKWQTEVTAYAADGRYWADSDEPHDNDIVAVHDTDPRLPALQIEAGKCYVDENGDVVGPMEALSDVFIAVSGDGRAWSSDGESVDGKKVAKLVAEHVAKVPKFKVGDRVRLIKNVDGAEIGTTATIRHDDGSEVMQFAIEFDTHPTEWDSHTCGGLVRSHKGWYVGQSDIELIPATETNFPAGSAIVCVIEDGAPAPSARPYVHDTKAQAEAEAKRLAGLHKGKEFVVFTAGNGYIEAKPEYKHEWQRLAAEGDTYAAGYLLSVSSGISLESADVAVKAWRAA